PNIKPPLLQSESDYYTILSQFFDWLMTQPGYTSERQNEILQPIKNILLAEDWDINGIKSPGDMTAEIWKGYGFTMGTLPRLREKISEFKQQRLLNRE